MKFEEEDYGYLNGGKFSNAYHMKLRENILYDRLTAIIRLTEGKRVLHVGCCDHIPLIEGKRKKQEWLHGLLDASCRLVVGVDIEQEAVDYVNSRRYSKYPVYCLDITAPGAMCKLPKYEFDFVILGEIVEHVNNPVYFLESLKRNLDLYGFTGKYIITVPNALSMPRNGSFRQGIEVVNSDHKYWFTPYTISKVMAEAGIKPEKLLFSSFSGGGTVPTGIQTKYLLFWKKSEKNLSGIKAGGGIKWLWLAKGYE